MTRAMRISQVVRLPPSPVPCHALALVALLAGACGDPTGTPDHVGTYTLLTVNGSSPPAVVEANAQWREEIVSGSIRLARNQECRVSMAWRVTSLATGQAVVTDFTVPCTYTIASGDLVMVFDDEAADGDPATIAGDEITLFTRGGVWVFRR